MRSHPIYFRAKDGTIALGLRSPEVSSSARNSGKIGRSKSIRAFRLNDPQHALLNTLLNVFLHNKVSVLNNLENRLSQLRKFSKTSRVQIVTPIGLILRKGLLNFRRRSRRWRSRRASKIPTRVIKGKSGGTQVLLKKGTAVSRWYSLIKSFRVASTGEPSKIPRIMAARTSPIEVKRPSMRRIH